MRVTIEPTSGGKYTAEFDAECISEVMQHIKGLLVNMGYHPRTVEDYIFTDDSWFADSVHDEHDMSNQSHPFLLTKQNNGS